jgi:predicted SAM-dependent methyltransferase
MHQIKTNTLTLLRMQIHPNFESPKFKDELSFEIRSWIGRHFLLKRSKIPINKQPLLIDIGVGANYRDGWIHVDFYSIQLKKFWKNWIKSGKPEVETDLRYPLNCPDNVVDGVYSGHTLEHLYPREAYQLLGEVFRILKQKCWLRINVPDIKRSIAFYNGVLSIPKYKFGAEAISNITQNWGHHSTWDEELLTYALEYCGFVNIKVVEYGKGGSDKRLIKEEECRREGTIVIEAQKP